MIKLNKKTHEKPPVEGQGVPFKKNIHRLDVKLPQKQPRMNPWPQIKDNGIFTYMCLRENQPHGYFQK